MKPTGRKLYPAQLVQIHVHKKKLNLSNDEYRDYLYDWTGERSSKDLTVSKAITVIENFDAMAKLMNMKNTMNLVEDKSKTAFVQKPGGLTLAQFGCIKGKATKLGFSETQLETFITHTTKQTVKVEDLKVRDASKVINGLMQREKELR